MSSDSHYEKLGAGWSWYGSRFCLKEHQVKSNFQLDLEKKYENVLQYAMRIIVNDKTRKGRKGLVLPEDSAALISTSLAPGQTQAKLQDHGHRKQCSECCMVCLFTPSASLHRYQRTLLGARARVAYSGQNLTVQWVRVKPMTSRSRVQLFHCNVTEPHKTVGRLWRTATTTAVCVVLETDRTPNST